MAINPQSKYPGQIAASNSNYPYGAAQNITTPGDGTGTPWDKDLLNDIWGFLQGVLSAAGITPSGSPDTAVASDYLDALDARYARVDSGVNMAFYESSAPTGWTQDTSINDKVLRVVSGSGGGAGGSWTISGLSVGGHALTTAEMPSHSHGVTDPGHSHTIGISLQVTQPNASANYNTILSGGSLSTNSAATGISIQNAGSGSAHSHGLTADGNWRPAYIDLIVCSKD